MSSAVVLAQVGTQQSGLDVFVVVAVVLGLVQAVRRPQDAPVSTGQVVALLALVIVVVLVNLMCTAWAAPRGNRRQEQVNG